MDLLQESASAFQKLLVYEYHFILGRKGQLRKFNLTFQKTDFHHLAGLHKLKDIAQLQQGMRDKIFENIITGKITMQIIEKSEYYKQMGERLLLLTGLEKMLDDNKIIFRYNEKVHKFSVIKADYLLEGEANNILSFLFLGSRNNNEFEQMCRTFFRVADKDYTEGQPQYTLLKKEKKNLISGKVCVQYDRLRS